MKNQVNQIAIAVIIIIFTTVSIFSMTAKSDTVSNKSCKSIYSHISDSTSNGNGDGKDTTDGSGGAGYPPKD